MSDLQLFLFQAPEDCLGSPPPMGLFLFGVKKKQKTPAENFSFKVSGLAVSVEPEKFIRPDLSRTGVQYYGLVGRNTQSV
ncbi:hypothetical protein QFZ20_004193 [Flavobacterium sp. W4I14]|nr:hypothetical protein [Flavobacterium sp. W4I14]